MPRVIILNGPAGVGKTTVGRLLAALAPNGACVHGDDLKGFVVRRSGNAVRTGLGYINGATVAANFVNANYDLVVFEFVFEHPAHIDRFLRAFQADASIHLFTLWASRETVIARERARPDREQLGTRVVECYDAIAGHLSALGHRIETEDQTPEGIAREIFALSEADVGRIDRTM